MPILENIRSLVTCRDQGAQADVHAIPDAALVWTDDRIRWVGERPDLPPEFEAEPRWDAQQGLVIPGLIDCHTHLAFGGWRAEEFELRIKGTSYLDIARAGGGIAATMTHTRRASMDLLIRRSLQFLNEMAKLGVTTVECKSGYGMNISDELKQLQVYAALKKRQPLRLVPTFLAHIVPQSYHSNREQYIRQIRELLLPRIAEQHLAEFCDVFVEDTAFTPDEARNILIHAQALGLKAKLHADQLSDGGGAQLAVELGATSVDHLECVSEAGIAALAASNVTAVSLPLAALYLNQRPLPARALIEAGVPVAVATDFNPGSAPSYHLPLAMMLACTLQRMTPDEALKGATTYAARALGLGHATGTLEANKAADFVVLDAPSVNHWLYHFTPNAALLTVAGGQVVYQAR